MVPSEALTSKWATAEHCPGSFPSVSGPGQVMATAGQTHLTIPVLLDGISTRIYRRVGQDIIAGHVYVHSARLADGHLSTTRNNELGARVDLPALQWKTASWWSRPDAPASHPPPRERIRFGPLAWMKKRASIAFLKAL